MGHEGRRISELRSSLKSDSQITNQNQLERIDLRNIEGKIPDVPSDATSAIFQFNFTVFLRDLCATYFYVMPFNYFSNPKNNNVVAIYN